MKTDLPVTHHNVVSHRSNTFLLLAFFAIFLPFPATGQNTIKTTKRGIAYLGDSHYSDNSLLLASNSPLSWYYNWSPYPSFYQFPLNGPLAFTPLIHSLPDASNSRVLSAINSLPSSSTHLLTFNEPDGTTESGGSAISPEDAARSYIDNIVPLRSSASGKRQWLISHPSVTGSGPGLDWLRRFNESCYAIDPTQGCPTDFIAAHWYGNFVGLASWLGTLDEYYNGGANRSSNSPGLKIWVTEMALPQATPEATLEMMNQTLPYLENLTYVEKYAWFGAFRSNDANEWTGDSVALFDQHGGLTELGSLYMGGSANGFAVGQTGNTANAAGGGRRMELINTTTGWGRWLMVLVVLLVWKF